jgi:hypothetical protein
MEQLSAYPDLLARVAALHQDGLSRVAIAERLNAEGWRPAKRRHTFTAGMVQSLLVRQGLYTSRSRPRSVPRTAEEWTFPELAATLGIPHPTLYAWLRKGQLRARHDQATGQWVIWADGREVQRLRALRQAPRLWHRCPLQTASEHNTASAELGQARGQGDTGGLTPQHVRNCSKV